MSNVEGLMIRELMKWFWVCGVRMASQIWEYLMMGFWKFVTPEVAQITIQALNLPHLVQIWPIDRKLLPPTREYARNHFQEHDF